MERDLKKFLKEYRVELIAILVVLVGIFLLVGQFDIRLSIVRLLQRVAGFLIVQGRLFGGWLVAYFATFTLSDLLGWLFIGVAGAFFVWRTRYRFLHSPRWMADTCHRCGSSLQRVHRTRLDRLLGKTLLPHSRRYQCTNTACGWSGLRQYLYPMYRSSAGGRIPPLRKSRRS